MTMMRRRPAPLTTALLLGAGTTGSSFHTTHQPKRLRRRPTPGTSFAVMRSAADIIRNRNTSSSDDDRSSAADSLVLLSATRSSSDHHQTSTNDDGTATTVTVVEPKLLAVPPTNNGDGASANTCADPYEATTPYASDLLFLFKPPGLLTLPGIGPDKADCLASRANQWLQNEKEGRRRMANVRAEAPPAANGKKKKRKKNTKQKKPYVPRPCHRLDYDTSGIVVMALTPHAQRCGQMAFEDRRTDKTYVALVAGDLAAEGGTVEYAIGKVPDESGQYNRWACDVTKGGDDASAQQHLPFIEGSLRPARTEWRVLAQEENEEGNNSDRSAFGANYTRVELKPVTGRGHQLRLHMAAIGHPILGDVLHAPREVADASPRLCLHAQTLRLPVLNDDGEVVLASATYPVPF